MKVRILVGDALARLRDLPDASVQCCVTSPPYWGLRDYGVEGQIGLEPSLDEWCANLVDVFREVRRVLRNDGTLWMNMGDAYCAGTSTGRKPTTTAGGRVPANWAGRSQPPRTPVVDRLKSKDLIGQPWMLAFALRADGWWLRRDIIWHKPNPAPETVRDRPTTAHEYVFLLSKQSRYYYNDRAAREPTTGGAHARRSTKLPSGYATGEGAHGSFHAEGRRAPGVTPKSAAPGSGIKANESFKAATVDLVHDRNWRSVWTFPIQPFAGAHFATFPIELAARCITAGSAPGDTVLDVFGGSGTTAIAADRLERNAVLIELKPEFAELARKRTRAETQLLADVTVEVAA